MRRISRSLLIAFVTGAAVASTAMAEDVYKWTDAAGVTHYADAPPAGTQYEKLNVSRGTSRAAEEPAEASPEATAATPAEGTTPETSAGCVQARANLQTLRTNPVVRKDVDGDGTPEVISGDAMHEEIARAQKLADAFCN
jgi:hypothetical protein